MNKRTLIGQDKILLIYVSRRKREKGKNSANGSSNRIGREEEGFKSWIWISCCRVVSFIKFISFCLYVWCVLLPLSLQANLIGICRGAKELLKNITWCMYVGVLTNGVNIRIKKVLETEFQSTIDRQRKHQHHQHQFAIHFRKSCFVIRGQSLSPLTLHTVNLRLSYQHVKKFLRGELHRLTIYHHRHHGRA